MPAVPKPQKRKKKFSFRTKGREKISHNKVWCAGRRFDSALERDLFIMLYAMEQQGEISDLRQQHKVYLTDAQIGIIPDFSAIIDGKLEFLEAKGFMTPEWLLKVKLWGKGGYGPGPLHVFIRRSVNKRQIVAYKHSYVPSVSKPVEIPYWKNLGGMRYA